MTGKVPRRGFLASIGASFLASGVASAVGTSTSTQSAVVLKGDRKQPIRQKDITQARTEFLQQHGLDDGTKFALRSFAGGSSKRVIGYGIAIDNGVPVESVYTIPSPEQLIPADTDGPEKTDVSTKGTSEFTSISDSISQFHSDLDTFADGNRDSVVDSVSSSQTPTTQLAEPEPGWVKQGEINEATAVYWNLHGENIQVGRIDLDTEIWKSGDETRDYEDKYACALRGEMWPSPSIDHLNTPSIFRNEGSHLIQDWDRTSMGSPTITESSPDTEKTESINTTLSVSSTDSAQLSLDWETPYIGRTETSQPDETVGWKFDYPWNGGNNGRRSRVELKSLGEAWLDASHASFDTILTTEFEGEFRRENTSEIASDTLDTPIRWANL